MKATLAVTVALGLGALVASAPASALEPAGGSPEPSSASDTRDSNDKQDASVEEAPSPAPARDNAAPRSWLARGGDSQLSTPPRESSGVGTGLTLGAVLIVLGLGAAAVGMRFKRQKLAPLSPSESRLTVLSSSRVGPKAYAVTAHVGGRVLLLGVTDHTVTNLGWLDPPEPSPPARQRAEAEGESEPEPEADELPDDYPGSALRGSQAPVAFATSSDLERFQQVLRGAVKSRPELPMRPSYAPSAPDAATMLAAQTTDIVAAGTPPPPASIATPTAATPLSLRRKRRGRDSFPPREPREPREPRVAVPSRVPQAPSPSLEGQVAGLRSLRER
ncbi:MAG TPA: flagellar biosynthetic protein FliO [Polyangiaceae bacterium]|nr:flagellar biosynthetic protein FliO [Polyangiaceae bacterium]